jgi:hypothetical protein
MGVDFLSQVMKAKMFMTKWKTYTSKIYLYPYSPLSPYGYFFKPTTKIAWFKPKNYKKA